MWQDRHGYRSERGRHSGTEALDSLRIARELPIVNVRRRLAVARLTRGG